MVDFTTILKRAKAGDPNAAEDLLITVYEELRQMAARRMAAESPAHTLQPTVLVHDAWVRLGAQQQPSWENRAHFFAAASEAMRRILVDHARSRLAAKRGGGARPLNIDNMELPANVPQDETLMCLHEALDGLEQADPRTAELVKLRYFVGMSYAEAAAAMGISVPTAKQWWAYARAWLLNELDG